MRYIQLDVIRGLAATAVFFSHAIGLIPNNNSVFFKYISVSPLHVFWDGAAAVNLFFVLSGFCIATPYIGKYPFKKISYICFLGKRFFRLYPAYFLSVILCLVLKNICSIPSTEYISQWGVTFWQWDGLSAIDIINIVSLIGIFDTHLLNPPSWSLVVEMRAAFLLPFLIILMRCIKQNEIVSVILSIVVSLAFPDISVLVYMPLFLVGIIIAKYREKIILSINILPRYKYICLAFFAFYLYTFRFPMEVIVYKLYGYHMNNQLIDLLAGAGSSIFIVLSFRKRACEILIHGIFIFLGKVSYSLYLVHFPILLMTYSLHEYFFNNIFIIIACSFFITLLVANLTYKYIELPCIKYGRKLIK